MFASGRPRARTGSEVLLSAVHRAGRGAASLQWRLRVFFLGAVLGLAGIFLDASWLLAAALIVLLGGTALRWLPSDEADSEDQEPEAPAP